jgi:hypothetical protein
VGRYIYNQPLFRWDHIFSDNDKFYTLAAFQHGTPTINTTFNQGYPGYDAFVQGHKNRSPSATAIS